jgi:hypothetical protein
MYDLFIFYNLCSNILIYMILVCKLCYGGSRSINIFILGVLSFISESNINPTVQHDLHVKLCLESKFYIFYFVSILGVENLQ